MPQAGMPRSGNGVWLIYGGAMIASACGLLLLSFEFRHGEGFEERPILEVTIVLVAAGAIHAAASLRALVDPPPLLLVLSVGLIARAVLIPSRPIQEDDIYRYIWDGRVGAEGLDPYVFSPSEIERFEAGVAPARIEPGREAILGRLAALKGRSPETGVIFSRINNRRHASVYPLLSQGVFQIHGRLVPASWPAHAQVAAMKAILTAFDLATLASLIILLRAAGKPAGLSLIYAWCPLVLKEVSNSGHMDSIAAAFLVAGIAALRSARGGALISGLALGAAVASKLYALIVLPLALRALGLRRGIVALAAALAVIVPGIIAYPLGAERRRETIVAFALSWENHDAIFTWIRRAAELCGNRSLAPRIPGSGRVIELESAHVLALATAGAAVAAILVVLAARTSPRSSPGEISRRVFLLLAAVFLLGPIGFPWYFIPCAALLAFARERAWTILPGLLMVYYLRFWYHYRFPGPYAGFESGVDFFDHVVVSAEVALFGLALSVELLRNRPWRRRRARLDPRPAQDGS